MIKLTDFVEAPEVVKKKNPFFERMSETTIQYIPTSYINDWGFDLKYQHTSGHFEIYSSYIRNPEKEMKEPIFYILGLDEENPTKFHKYTGDLDNFQRDSLTDFLVNLTYERVAKANAPKEYKFKDPVLQPVVTETPMHFSNLLFDIGNMGVTLEEFESTIAHSIIQAKETKQPVLISYAGVHDLLITENRIHVIQMVKTYNQPELIEAD